MNWGIHAFWIRKDTPMPVLLILSINSITWGDLRNRREEQLDFPRVLAPEGTSQRSMAFCCCLFFCQFLRRYLTLPFLFLGCSITMV